MQNQMEASLARMKSPGLKSNMPASPTARNFANRQSLILDNTSNFLSPDSAAAAAAVGANSGSGASDPAAKLAQQRAKLKASNAAHRISAPVLASAGGGVDVRASWAAGPSLAQVSELNGPGQDIVVASSRPKSSDFSGSLPSPHLGGGGGGNLESDSWASMVNTPAIALFPKTNNTQSLDSASTKLNEWNNKGTAGAGAGASAPPGVPRMGDPTIHRRKPVGGDKNNDGNNQHYDDNGNPISGGNNNQNQQDQRGRNAGGGGGGMRNPSGGNGGWGNPRGQAPQNQNSQNRFNDNDPNNNNNNNMNGLGVQLGGLHLGMGSPQMPGMQNAAAAALAGMAAPMSPFNMNMLSAMALSPEAQLLAAQIAAANAGGYGHPPSAAWMGMGMQPLSAAAAGMGMNMGGGNAGMRRGGGPPSGRSPGLRSVGSVGGGRVDNGVTGNAPKGEEDVDPSLLNDIPAWLRSLRLHKYTPNFEGMKWQDIVVMDEAQLEGKGVAALGARRKMLKTFEVVRKKMGMEGAASAE